MGAVCREGVSPIGRPGACGVALPCCSMPAALFGPSALIAASAAFGVVFGLFAAAMVVLIVVTLRWAIRRDRTRRRAWMERRADRQRLGGAPPAGQLGNGSRPAQDRARRPDLPGEGGPGPGAGSTG